MQTQIDPLGTLRVSVILHCGPRDPITCENAVVAEDVTLDESLRIVRGLQTLNPSVTFQQEWTASI